MRVKFANGTVKSCTAPTEQKVFKNVGGETVGTGWVLLFKLIGGVTSSEIDSLMTDENVGKLEFLPDESEEAGCDTALFTLEGYNKVTSSVIRYAEELTAVSTELQLSKGL